MFKKLTTATWGIMKNNPLLGVALNANIRHRDKSAEAVIAWGQKPFYGKTVGLGKFRFRLKSSHTKAHEFAKKHQLPLITIEDGFLRSLDSGTNSVGASFIVDDKGVYFDLTAPNRLQEHIKETLTNWDNDKEQIAQHLIQKIIGNKLSKYNATTHAPDLSILANNNKPHVIIIDQVANDASIKGAGADGGSFDTMLTHAKQNYPDANIWIKAHPAGKGYFRPDDVCLPFYLTDNCNPIALLSQATAVYTVSSHMGFEALMLGKKVHNFGVNWYAGFGLTDDEFIKNHNIYQNLIKHYATLNLKNPTINQLFYASYVRYSCYANPATHEACDVETVMDYLSANRDWQDRLFGKVLAYDFSRWKVPFVRGFLGFNQVNLIIKPKTRWLPFLPYGVNQKRADRASYHTLSNLPPDTAFVVWGQKSKQLLGDKLAKLGVQKPKIWCMEDGFIRSNGLGATLIAPLSVVMDDVGIYFDATAPSRLEMMLNEICLNNEQRQRAKNLHTLMLTRRVSKYNVPTKNHEFIHKIDELKVKNRRIHLVVGQVEDDASVNLCASIIKKNSDLLARVRVDFPDDIIIYKPHPDVEAGLRAGKADNHHLADLVASDVAMPDCLDILGEHDRVHTISSLTGFEALLRHKKVVCYGLPFYAGFGLTCDVVETDNLPKLTALTRRKREHLPPLDLDSLIYATLIDYPIYRLPHGVGLATPENVIDYLYHHKKPTTFTQNLTQNMKTKFMQLRKAIT